MHTLTFAFLLLPLTAASLAAQGTPNGHTVMLLRGNNFGNSQARNPYLILQHEKIDKVAVVGHSMGGMLAAGFATQHPKAVERVVIYNPIGFTDGPFARPMTPIDEAYRQNLKTDWQSTRAGLGRYAARPVLL